MPDCHSSPEENILRTHYLLSNCVLLAVSAVVASTTSGCPDVGSGSEPAADIAERSDASTPDTGRSCSSHSDCEDSVCDPVENVCVECTKSEHCSAPDPLCSDNKCTGCTKDEHCESGGRCSDGTCASGEIELQPSTLRLSASVGVARNGGISVVNNGDAAVGISDVRLEEESGGEWDDQREFSASGDWSRTFELSAGEERPFAIEYAPVNDQDDRGAFVVEHEFGKARATVEGTAN